MDRFEDMRCFVHVVENGSVTRAADALSIAPSAVSRRIKELEGRLGVQLLARTTRRMSLTEAGQTFYVRSLRILEDVEDAEGEVADASHALRGILRIAAPLDLGTSRLAPIITEFAATHPDVQVDLDLSDRMTDLVGEGFDVGIRVGTLRDSTLVARKLTDVRMVVCAAPGLVQERGLPEHPEDLADWPALAYVGSERADIWRFSRPDGTEGSVQVSVRLRANNGTVLARAAENGLGATLQPVFIVGRLLDEGRLVPLLESVRWPELSLYAVYPQTRHLSLKTRAFIDFMRNRIDRNTEL